MSSFENIAPIVITCPNRIGPFLNREVADLGYPLLAEMAAGIETQGTMLDAMRLNLHVRTGFRVLYLLKKGRARTPEELYRLAFSVPWETWFDSDGYVSVVSSVNHPTINDSRFANLKVKDAIVDRMVQHCGNRPDSGPDTSKAVVFLHWNEYGCAIYLDTSGDPLTRRGYRKMPWKAPMGESLAAAAIIATGWNGIGNFVNPMCGSGTLAIEAALIGLGRAPGLQRDNFAFMHLRDFNAERWESLCNDARTASAKKLDGVIVATDIHPDALVAARRNAAAAGVDGYIEFDVCDFADTRVPEGGGVVMLNPEYGARLGNEEELQDVYAGIGDFFKQQCAGYRGYIFTGNLDLAKRVGLRTSRRIPMYNSTIDCRLLEYELYAGTR